jgi:oxygen-independent coproporphyrinogen-3 oxidase
MLGMGVAAFSHVQGVHFQNEHEFDTYRERVNSGKLPVYRALEPEQEERMIRELILQLKLGHLSKSYFENKFDVDIEKRFAESFAPLRDAGYLTSEGDAVLLNREGLLRVDALLSDFFLPKHRVARVV